MKKISQWLTIFALLALLTACGSEANLPYKNINNDELQTMLDQNVTLIDIRRPEEWKQTGVIANSKTMTFFFKNGQVNPDFIPWFQQTISDKNQPVILICRTGNRSKTASDFIAKSMAYTHVYNVRRGITGWISEKRVVTHQ